MAKRKQTFEITLVEYGSGEESSKPIDGYIVTEHFGSYRSRGNWIVVHLPTGASCGWMRKLEGAKLLCKSLESIPGVDWSGKDRGVYEPIAEQAEKIIKEMMEGDGT